MKFLICLFFAIASNSFAADKITCSSSETSSILTFNLAKKVPTLSVSYGKPMNCSKLPIAMVAKGGTPAIVSCSLRHGPDGSSEITLYAQSSITRVQKATSQAKGPQGLGKLTTYNCN